MKKRLLLLCSALLLVLMAAAQNNPSADEMLKNACAKAGRENKKVFVMFTASWCGWCHRMKKSMEDEEIKNYFSSQFETIYFVVDESPDKKNLETPGAAAYKSRYGGDNQGIPFWLVIDKDGNLSADSMKPDGSPTGKINSGCPAEKDEVEYFISVLKKTTTLDNEALEKISKRFLKNKG